MNLNNRSFLLDEALLVTSLSQKNFLEIFTLDNFEYNQPASIIWITLIKIIASIFGYHEYVLRSISVTSFILIILLLIYIQKIFYQSKIPLLAAAIFANINFALRQSNMLNQYEFDGLIALVILGCYLLYKSKKIGYKTLSILWIFLIWCSQIACFVEYGLILSELIFSIISKNKQEIRNTLITVCLISLSLVAYYFTYTNATMSLGKMQNAFGDVFFPLLPKNSQEFNKAISLIVHQIFSKFRHTHEAIVLFIISIGFFIYKKDRAIIGICLGIFLTLLLSSFKFYPISEGPCFFIIPIIILIITLLFENIVKDNFYAKLSVITIILVILYNSNTAKLSNDKNLTYINGEEINQQIRFINRNIKPDEMVYVWLASIDAFKLKHGNNKFRIGRNIKKDNIIYGTTFFRNEDKCQEELEKILSYPKIYLVTSHIGWRFWGRIKNLFDKLNQVGFLELAQFEHGTTLWFFSKSKEDCKLNYEFNILQKDDVYTTQKAKIHIKNTGDVFLNTPYNQTYLVDTVNGNFYPLYKYVSPKSSIDIDVVYKRDSNPRFTLVKQFGKICKEKFISLKENKNFK